MKKKINYTILKISLLIIIGILAIITPAKYIIYFHTTLHLGILSYTIINIIFSIKKHNFSYFNLIFAIIILLLIISINFFHDFYIRLIPTIISIYIFIIGLSRLMTIFIYQEIPESKINILINSLIHFIFSIIIFIKPTDNIKSFTFITGLYLIILGLSYIPKGSHQKNNIRIVQIPMIFQSLKPYSDFIKIDFNNYNRQENQPVDLEVLIHVRKNKRGVFGHADLIYQNKVYSYGNYDTSSYKLLDAIGDGVLIEADKQQYINYCKSYGKTLFSFGIKLNKMEKAAVESRFDQIMSHTYIFDKDKVVKGSYIDKLNQNANTTFYKFKDGYYQHYFFLNYNCVKFIEEIISPDLLNFKSIKTPGTLYTHLEEEYNRENSHVIQKIIY